MKNNASLIQIRRKLRMNQTDFWTRIGVTQSGGSRYESGRSVPKPVVLLLTIAYGNRAGADKTVKTLRGGK